MKLSCDSMRDVDGRPSRADNRAPAPTLSRRDSKTRVITRTVDKHEAVVVPTVPALQEFTATGTRVRV